MDKKELEFIKRWQGQEIGQEEYIHLLNIMLDIAINEFLVVYGFYQEEGKKDLTQAIFYLKLVDTCDIVEYDF